MLDAWSSDGRDRVELRRAVFVATVDGERGERFVDAEIDDSALR